MLKGVIGRKWLKWALLVFCCFTNTRWQLPGVKQPQCIISQFCRSEVWGAGLTGCYAQSYKRPNARLAWAYLWSLEVRGGGG